MRFLFLEDSVDKADHQAAHLAHEGSVTETCYPQTLWESMLIFSVSSIIAYGGVDVAPPYLFHEGS